ncbi:MAG: FAD-binding oxidoreductase [Bryobacterales bacterium]|nr:FAD-binding oxidoreductase [Bryobacterales bacterium]
MWLSVLPAHQSLGEQEAQARYAAATHVGPRRIRAALFPESTEEVARILRSAQQDRVSVYPVSSGKNWGYGCTSPVVDDCVILDLSRMSRILAADRELGTVTLQPGVTQKILAEWLDREALPWMVPTNGGGPDCSIIGNALERGYGTNVVVDHCLSIQGLEAVLPDGRIWKTPFAQFGLPSLESGLRWGVGPYLGGLFSQSNFGVVTQATVRLAPRLAGADTFFFFVKSAELLPELARRLQGIFADLGAMVPAIVVMNDRRALSLSTEYPSRRSGLNGTLSRDEVAAYARMHRLSPWMGVGSLRGLPGIVKEARRHIRGVLGPLCTRMVFAQAGSTRLAHRLLGSLPIAAAQRWATKLDRMQHAHEVFQGRPDEVALRLPYWQTPQLWPKDRVPNPAVDGVGIYWYTAVVLGKADTMAAYADWIERRLPDFGFEPFVSFVSNGEGSYLAPTPINFNRGDADACRRAVDAYHTLLEEGKTKGFFPYRTNPTSMSWLTSQSPEYWEVVASVKRALDPNGILAPGRYCPDTR